MVYRVLVIVVDTRSHIRKGRRANNIPACYEGVCTENSCHPMVAFACHLRAYLCAVSLPVHYFTRAPASRLVRELQNLIDAAGE